jgi:hypothetical protein
MRLTFLFILISILSFSQKKLPFQGKLVYEIEMVDTSLQRIFPKKIMTVYTNDTIVRIENDTKQFGQQVVIKHTHLNKSYLLLNDGINKFAIQTDLNKKTISDSTENGNSYKKKCGKRTVLNFKANRLLVTPKDASNRIEILYLKQYDSKYIDAYKESPGLPVKYFLYTNEGLAVYRLVRFEEFKPEHDLFGIPSDYRKVSFDDFIELMYKNQNNESIK